MNRLSRTPVAVRPCILVVNLAPSATDDQGTPLAWHLIADLCHISAVPLTSCTLQPHSTAAQEALQHQKVTRSLPWAWVLALEAKLKAAASYASPSAPTAVRVEAGLPISLRSAYFDTSVGGALLTMTSPSPDGQPCSPFQHSVILSMREALYTSLKGAPSSSSERNEAAVIFVTSPSTLSLVWKEYWAVVQSERPHSGTMEFPWVGICIVAPADAIAGRWSLWARECAERGVVLFHLSLRTEVAGPLSLNPAVYKEEANVKVDRGALYLHLSQLPWSNISSSHSHACAPRLLVVGEWKPNDPQVARELENIFVFPHDGRFFMKNENEPQKYWRKFCTLSKHEELEGVLSPLLHVMKLELLYPGFSAERKKQQLQQGVPQPHVELWYTSFDQLEALVQAMQQRNVEKSPPPAFPGGLITLLHHRDVPNEKALHYFESSLTSVTTLCPPCTSFAHFALLCGLSSSCETKPMLSSFVEQWCKRGVELAIATHPPSLVRTEEEGFVGLARFHEWLHCWWYNQPIEDLDKEEEEEDSAAPHEEVQQHPVEPINAVGLYLFGDSVEEEASWEAVLDQQLWKPLHAVHHPSAAPGVVKKRFCVDHFYFFAVVEVSQRSRPLERIPPASGMPEEYPAFIVVVTTLKQLQSAAGDITAPLSFLLYRWWVQHGKEAEEDSSKAFILYGIGIPRSEAVEEEWEDAWTALLNSWTRMGTPPHSSHTNDNQSEEEDEMLFFQPEMIFEKPSTPSPLPCSAGALQKEESDAWPEGCHRLREAFWQNFWSVRSEKKAEEAIVKEEAPERVNPDPTPPPSHRLPPAVVDTCTLPPHMLVHPSTLRSTPVQCLKALQKAPMTEREGTTEERKANYQQHLKELQDWVEALQRYGQSLGKERRRAQAELLSLAVEKVMRKLEEENGDEEMHDNE